MKRAIKKNLILISVLIGTGVVALGLLVYAVIIVLEKNTYFVRTEQARDKVAKLNKAKPAPGRENEERIQKDIDLYTKAAKGLRDSFKSPLQPAVDLFLRELKAPKLERLSDEEKEKYRVPPPPLKDGEERSEEELAKLPVKIRQLTQEEFLEFFNARFEQKIPDQDFRATYAAQTQFIVSFRQLFPNWNEAVEKFSAEVGKYTDEPLSHNNQIPLLLYSLGIPHAVPDKMEGLMENYSEVINKRADAGKIFLDSDATKNLFFSDSNDRTLQNLSVEDRRGLLFHCDVFCDLIKRLCQAKVRKLSGFEIRNYSDGTGYSRFAKTSEQIGSYLLYHYTIKIEGTMDEIRAAAKVLDQGYKDNRVYIVRAITFYAKENGAGLLMKQESGVKKDKANNGAVRSRSSRFRRRGQPAVNAVPEERSSEEQAQQEEIERRKLAEFEAKLPVEQRTGYGETLIGVGKDFVAFLDVDYIVLSQNQ